MKNFASSEMLIDNNRIRIIKWHFLPNESTGKHEHEFDYVVVPTKTGQLSIIDDNGVTNFDLKLNEPYFRNKGVIHEIFYGGNDYMEFIEIEIK